MIRWAILVCVVGYLAQTEGISINIINNKIQCNGLDCPPSSDACSVKSNTNSDRTAIVTEVKCLRNGTALSEKVSLTPNPGGAVVSSSYISSLGGSVNVIQSSGNFFASSYGGYGDLSDLDKDIIRDVQAQVADATRDIGRQLRDGFEDFRQNFPNWF